MKALDIINNSISMVEGYIESDSNHSLYANVADSYLPIGPNDRDNNIDWTRVYQEVIGSLYNRTLNNRTLEQLKNEVIDITISSRDTRELADVINEIYFSGDELLTVTPLAYLINKEEKSNARTKTMINIIRGLTREIIDKQYDLNGCNPIENHLISVIADLCICKGSNENYHSYLPFLSQLFSKDLNALAENTTYLLEEIENFVAFYVFIYLTQLTIHVCTPAHRYKKPEAKKLYFILETEPASKERHECNQFGYEYLFSKTTGLAYSIFPLLGYLNRITKKPVWDVDESEMPFLLPKVNEFNKCLSQLFGEIYYEEDTVHKALNKGMSIHKQIFDETLRSSKPNSRKSRNKIVVSTFENNLSAGFITNRRGAGKYFVLKSEMIILITNLIISQTQSKRILIDDLIQSFNERGVWFDLKSKKALLKFYETVGNIEKLSDSGDAVYVKSTV
ncbi:DNA phosphorothioation-dependent restriction protein DptG [Pantoea agglomerans]|uniref:DNA phosphorothioation-dependent restriction protein DptG n=1 Tax=Enterobacter agglomerans TaxID=549 RepID=UPI0015F9A285|nr:DNA phosphorothioation-dependent restriction protein DptG [Pantoea agglomerans]MBA8870515.1 DNA phosphorothioation-dependent restriction protein DptG [Pantoea agglomerans]MBA8874886.1 DNA phosphorothioation-dependent restriction protein DptG [Pantoea agglomerans]